MGGMEGQWEGWILKTCKSQTCKYNNAGRICMSGVCVLWRPVLENKLTKVSLNNYCAVRSKTKPNRIWCGLLIKYLFVAIINPIESQQMTTARQQECNITILNQSKNNFFHLAIDFCSDSMELLIFNYMEN